MVLLGLTAITLLSLDLSGFGPIGTAQRWVRDLLHPVTQVAGAIASPFSNAWNAVFDYDDLEAERDQLRKELDDAEGAQLAAEAEREAFQRLLEATEITYLPTIPTETADVVRTAVGNFDDHVITIEKGSNHGIRPGMAVVTGAGLVGRVDRVDATTANVQLLSDSELVIGVRLVSTGEVGLGHTDAEDPLTFVIDRGLDWPEDDDQSLLPEIGTVVVTAASSRYPAEIPLGRIKDVYLDPENDIAMIVEVELANDVRDLSYATVLLAEGVDQVPLVPTPSTSIPLNIEVPEDTGSDQ
ncbi:MAG: rod shape-determining protein MreC [Acidimicrobiales bacterium]|nr:rod shape-determining protein MreC [Acidimicrobiales bacterium]